MYAPGVGRFISRDPIGYEGSPGNLYRAYFVPNGLDAEGTHDTVGSDGYPPYPTIGQPSDNRPILWPITVQNWPPPGDFETGNENCLCQTTNGHRMRPTSPSTGKTPPAAGTPVGDCDVGEVVIVKYKSSCKPNPKDPCESPPCEASVCYHYVSYRCALRGRIGPNDRFPSIKTKWVNGPHRARRPLSKCSL